MPLFDWIRSDLHSLNLDWIISKIKTVEESEQGAVDAAANANASKTAAAASATAANNSKTAAAGSATAAAGSAAQAQALVDQLDTTIAQDVTDWLDEHITPTTPAVDDTLTVSGAAADAAVTGDKITELKTGLNRVEDFTGIVTGTTEINQIDSDTTSQMLITKKWILGILNANTLVTKCQMLIPANSTTILKLEKWRYNAETQKYTLSETVEGTVIEQVANGYIIDFGSFFIDNDTILTYSDTSSGGWGRYRNVSGYSTKKFDGTLTAVSLSDITDTPNVKFEYRLTFLQYAELSVPVTVDINGSGKYTSVIDAVNNEPENTVIYIKPGVYEGTIEAFTKRVILIGTDRNQCVLKCTDGRYQYPVINCSCGYLENLTLKSVYVNGVSNEIDSNSSGAYALHCENQYGAGKTLELHHCTLSSDFFPAIGCGLRKDFTFILDDCILSNNQIVGRGAYSNLTEGSLGALYFHDANGEQGDQFVTVKNCVLKSTLGSSMTPFQVEREPQNNHVYCEFIQNVLHDERHGYSNNVWYRGDPFNPSTGVFEITIGYGNSNNGLNN